MKLYLAAVSMEEWLAKLLCGSRRLISDHRPFQRLGLGEALYEHIDAVVAT
jgi:hypothetical protein